MSLVFSTVLLLLLFAPGVIFRRSFYTDPFARSDVPGSVVDEVAWAVFPGILLHALMLPIIALLGYGIDFPVLGYLLVGTNNDALAASTFRAVGRRLGPIIWYHLSLWLAAALLGIGAKHLVRHFSLHKRTINWLGLSPWYFLLYDPIEWRTPPAVWVDALVKTSRGTILYSGIVTEYVLSKKTGELDAIYFASAARSEIANQHTTEAVEIPGDYFVIKYSDVINLNISYVTIEEEVSQVQPNLPLEPPDDEAEA